MKSKLKIEKKHQIGESRDSGVSENHSRQSSELFSVEEQENDRILMDRKNTNCLSNQQDDETRIKNIEKQIREQEVRARKLYKN